MVAAIVRGEAEPERTVQRISRFAVALDYPADMMELYCLEDDLDIRYGPNAVTPERWEAAARSASERLLASAGRSAV